MADENQPEPTVRVRYTVAVTVDGANYAAGDYETDVPESTAKQLVSEHRAKRVKVAPPPEPEPAPLPHPAPVAASVPVQQQPPAPKA